MLCKQVVRDNRQHDIELEVTGLTGHRNRGVVANDLRADHCHRFRYHRVDLARHDAGTGLQRWQRDFAQSPRAGR